MVAGFQRVLRNRAGGHGPLRQRAGHQGRHHTPENFCSVSSLPWLSFTSFAQDTYAESRLLFPLIRVGKHFVQGRNRLIPVLSPYITPWPTAFTPPGSSMTCRPWPTRRSGGYADQRSSDCSGVNIVPENFRLTRYFSFIQGVGHAGRDARDPF